MSLCTMTRSGHPGRTVMVGCTLRLRSTRRWPARLSFPPQRPSAVLACLAEDKRGVTLSTRPAAISDASELGIETVLRHASPGLRCSTLGEMAW